MGRTEAQSSEPTKWGAAAARRNAARGGSAAKEMHGQRKKRGVEQRGKR